MEKIAVLDSGGQYCHLIARKVRELGVYAEILPIDVDPAELAAYRGVILSGGPSSVSTPGAPKPQAGLFELERPILGICYGHQLLAVGLDGVVEPGTTQEFGQANIHVQKAEPLFTGLPATQRVWMSHGDSVAKMPTGFEALATTPDCPTAAMGDLKRGYFGFQFHPEVVHTPHGSEILKNFIVNVCGCSQDWHPEDRVESLVAAIRAKVGERRVLFFLSGGVDSTVAYALTVQALGTEAVHGMYVDTGFMRHGETDAIEKAFGELNLGKLETVDASDTFFGRLEGVTDPETKRAIIGKAFVDIQDELLEREEHAGHDWLLGQGTIYPDTIESGGTSQAAVIKTHHNRVPHIQELIAQGRVLEPLAEFYKDEVRALGKTLGLADSLLWRHPFPGPALAIRCICSETDSAPLADAEIDALAGRSGYRGFLLPLRSVGVQGDARSYAQLTVLWGAGLDYAKALPLATELTNRFRRTNRIVLALTPETIEPEDWKIHRATLTRPRVELLQQADRIVTDFLHEEGLYDRIWQCPVVLLPFSRGAGETVALRPITSVDGMTAEVAELAPEKVQALAARIVALDGVDSVMYDLSHKPPSTIEWE
ncbi:MAG: glutamine-hydrolyzing GMP synthase [Acidobacteria bacterium]|nr:glutamine-hydrolyzing GMP synthase [Acidobacteriota bacterium]